MKKKLIVIGNGMAGIKTVEHLLAFAPQKYDITVYGAEPHPNYNRILLSPVLAGEMTLDDIVLNDHDWYREHGIRLRIGRKIIDIDRAQKIVKSDDGLREHYDTLLLATGSMPFMLPLPGIDLDGVISYRDIADTEAMIAATQRQKNEHKHAVVIGGGLLGLEAANGLKNRGMDVTVVHVMPWLMERQLDSAAALLLKASLEARGIKFLLEAESAEIVGVDGKVAALKFKNDEIIPADLLVMAVGIRPNVALGEAAELDIHRGIVVNDHMQTSDPAIYAVGECVAHRGVVYGLVAPLYEMAEVAAAQLAEADVAPYEGTVISTKLKVTGIDLFSAGNFMGAENCEEILLNDKRNKVYKKLVIQDNKLVGSVMIGDTSNSVRYLDMIKNGTDISTIRNNLMFLQEVA